MNTNKVDESLWLLSGEMTFEIQSKVYVMTSGDWLVLPRGSVHSARAGKEGAKYYIAQKKELVKCIVQR
ncbi:hypothetical protein AAMO2058_001363200 [Amorphochlora amoebiformis]